MNSPRRAVLTLAIMLAVTSAIASVWFATQRPVTDLSRLASKQQVTQTVKASSMASTMTFVDGSQPAPMAMAVSGHLTRADQEPTHTVLAKSSR